MPGQIKQAVDWASRPHGAESALWGETVAVVGASVTDYGGMWAQDHLRKSLGLAGARVLSEELPVARAPELFGSDGDSPIRKPATGSPGSSPASCSTTISSRRRRKVRSPWRPRLTPQPTSRLIAGP